MTVELNKGEMENIIFALDMFRTQTIKTMPAGEWEKGVKRARVRFSMDAITKLRDMYYVAFGNTPESEYYEDYKSYESKDSGEVELSKAPEAGKCRWVWDDVHGVYNTDCGGMYEKADGGYGLSKFSYCPVCGLKIAKA